MKTSYDLSKALPNKLLNADGSITDFQGNLISPPNDMNAKVYMQLKSIPNKFITDAGKIAEYAQVSMDIFVLVDVLPDSGVDNKVYLTPGENGIFNEYYWTGDHWDMLGTINLDLSEYPTYDDMNAAINNAVYDALGGEY